MSTIGRSSKKNRVRPANSVWRRLLRRWRAWRGAGLAKTHQVHLIELDGVRYKRVIFDSDAEASRVVSALQEVASIGRFPGVVRHDQREIWVDYVPGQLARQGSDDQQIVDLFIDLYRMPSSPIEPGSLGYEQVLARDLDYLTDAGRITSQEASGLAARANDLRPERLLIGHDYLDPIPRNFVIRDGQAVAIDIEALVANQPLGAGLAKAVLRWPGLDAGSFLQQLIKHGGPDLRAQYPWIELCFLAHYFRQKLIQRKPRQVRIGALLAHLAGDSETCL